MGVGNGVYSSIVLILYSNIVWSKVPTLNNILFYDNIKLDIYEEWTKYKNYI